MLDINKKKLRIREIEKMLNSLNDFEVYEYTGEIKEVPFNKDKIEMNRKKEKELREELLELIKETIKENKDV